VRKHTGAAQQKLIDGVKALAEKTKEELLATAADNTVAETEAYEGDLRRFVEMSRSECLNDDPNHSFTLFFQKDAKSVLKSDTDEQLLFTVAFKSIVSVRNIKFVAPDDGSAPKKVKLFVNRLNMNFDDAEEQKAAQEFELSRDDVKESAKPIQLDTLKFAKTDTVTVFVKSNQGSKDQTVIEQLLLWGRKC